MWEAIVSDALTWLSQREDESVDLIYVDPPFNTGRDRVEYSDVKRSPSDFRTWFQWHMAQAHRVLKPNGSIIVHLDYRAIHMARNVMDDIFGYDNCQNEIIWCYASGGASKKHLSRKHDNLAWYSKDKDNYTFNTMREPYPNDYGDRDGFHPEGRLLNDWWQIPIMSTSSKERTGYPTQKPGKLLERIVKLWSNPGDLVVDFFCGSGTTGVEAVKNGRDTIMVDKNKEAIRITRERLELVA